MTGAATSGRVTLLAETTEYGGAETYLVQLARHLPARFAVTIVATDPVPDALRQHAAADGVELVAVAPVRDKTDFAGMRRLWSALRATTPDEEHVNVSSTVNNRFGLLAVARPSLPRSRPPAVATVHSWLAVGGLQRLVLPRLYRRVQRVIAVSEQVRGELVRGLGLAPASVVVVPNGIAAAPAVTLDERQPVRIGVIGRLDPLKGVDLLLRALPRVLASGADVEVVVAGVGPDEDALRRTAAARALPVSFVGFVDDAASFLASLDVCCLPSRSEGLPFSLLEAMARGLPVVAFDVGAVGEALGDAGVLVPRGDVAALADGLTKLAGSVDERRRLGAAGRERATLKFSVQAMADATARLYDEAVTR
jgi:glycosyltransferase involved in cell wall biosynthesis